MSAGGMFGSVIAAAIRGHAPRDPIAESLAQASPPIGAAPMLAPDLELMVAACLFLLARPDRDAAHRRLRQAVDRLGLAEIPAHVSGMGGALLELRIASEMALRSRAPKSRDVAGEILGRRLTRFCEALRAEASMRDGADHALAEVDGLLPAAEPAAGPAEGAR